MPSRLSFVRLTAVALLLLQACSTAPTSSTSGGPGGISGPINPQTGVPGAVTPAETASYQEILTLYQKAVYESALAKIGNYKKRYKTSGYMAAIENLQGLCLLMTNRPTASIASFKHAIELTGGKGSFANYIRYNLAKAQLEANQLEESQRTMAQISISDLDRDNQVKVHFLKAKLNLRLGLALESARETLQASRLISDLELKEGRPVLAKTLEAALVEIKNLDSLEALRTEFEETPLEDILLYRAGSQQTSMGNTGTGEAYLHKLLAKYPGSPYALSARELLSTAQTKQVVDIHSVGVLVPMKGKFAKFGTRTLQAITLAFKLFEKREPDNKITLVIEDSGEDVDSAIAGLNRLVFKHNVSVVIGPLLSKGIDQVTRRAQDVGVPLVSLARTEGQSGDYIFQAGITLKLQAQEAARFAIEKMKLKRFAIIYPSDKVGTDSANTFWDAVEAMGGRIVGAESYAPNETDFRLPVDRLSGLAYPEARQRELDILAKLREDNKITKRTRKTEQFFSLKPIIDYDAVFVPDEPKVAGQIIPTFAYRDIENMKFLGTNAWDTPEFLTRLQEHASNAYFVTAFNPDSTVVRVKKFIDIYKSQYGMDPTTFEAIAYDAASIVEYALSQVPDLGTRADVRSQLHSIRGLQGITGKISYQDGQFSRDLRVFTAKGGKVVELP